jgi:ABC-type Na+ efflux pump permease subunit
MQKILTIARREYQSMVATKAFVFGMAMMPVLMLAGTWLPQLLKKMERAETRTIAIVDGTGKLFEGLKLAAEQRNTLLTMMEQQESAPTSGGEGTGPAPTTDQAEQRRARRAMGLEEIHRYALEQVPADGFDDEGRLALSERIRSKELYAFVEIPAGVLEPQPIDPSNPASLQLPAVTYIAEDAALSDARRWAETSLNQMIKASRMAAAGVPPAALVELERKAPVRSSGLFSRGDDGTIRSEEKPDELTSIFLPMGIMMLMFMIIMMSAQPMLESVLEEKSLRIAEVLLGSANAKQLMTGKLLGNVAGSLTVFALYALGGLVVARWRGYADSIPFHIMPWFVVYQLLAVLMFSSAFMAIAAAVTQLREAQSLLLPVWLVMLLPMFVWMNVIREPNSVLATTLSFFPPSTPMMMTLRLATGASLPLWQILLSVVVLVLATAAGVIAASRIYRIGILWQGKAPKISELMGWLIHDPDAPRKAA